MVRHRSKLNRWEKHCACKKCKLEREKGSAQKEEKGRLGSLTKKMKMSGRGFKKTRMKEEGGDKFQGNRKNFPRAKYNN